MSGGDLNPNPLTDDNYLLA